MIKSSDKYEEKKSNFINDGCRYDDMEQYVHYIQTKIATKRNTEAEQKS